VAESVARYQLLANQSQNMFLAILGHDLRNPLGTLVTGANFIMQATDIPARYVLLATRMLHSARRMGKLINDLIDLTRTHLGPGIPIRARPGNVVTVCAQVVSELRTYHPERLIRFKAPLQVDASFDADRIAQMLSNLIGNALQYSGEDDPVSVSMNSTTDEVVIAINNRGPAIPPDKLPGIFDPMVRMAAGAGADFTERTSLGIGLFIAREIAQAHGGRISVSSTGADGTSFTVTMPRRQEAALAADGSRERVRS
jgi:signal transduction histidine kinase